MYSLLEAKTFTSFIAQIEVSSDSQYILVGQNTEAYVLARNNDQYDILQNISAPSGIQEGLSMNEDSSLFVIGDLNGYTRIYQKEN